MRVQISKSESTLTSQNKIMQDGILSSWQQAKLESTCEEACDNLNMQISNKKQIIKWL